MQRSSRRAKTEDHRTGMFLISVKTEVSRHLDSIAIFLMYKTLNVAGSGDGTRLKVALSGLRKHV
jgi:hypothetical protein